jgi:hypothetical protein
MSCSGHLVGGLAVSLAGIAAATTIVVAVSPTSKRADDQAAIEMTL